LYTDPDNEQYVIEQGPNEPPTREEVKKALDSTKSGKAAGPDGIPIELLEPSVPGAGWTTSPATVRETTECHVDVAPQSLMGRSIIGEPDYVPEKRVTASDD